ncbi:MAG: antibiotic biosynthesis monooxygenase [Candidimonas sp.]|jgi:antibiotic biosynthesis monooxygenase (ABM) superfamily enzyme
MSSVSSPVTWLLTRRIAPDRYDEFQAWMRRGILLAAGFPGFLGAGVLAPPPGGDQYQIVLRFTDPSSMEKWERSLSRRMWLERGESMIRASELMRVDGLETVFGLREQLPPRWKRLISVWLVMFPTALTVNAALLAPLGHAPLALRIMAMTMIQAPLMMFVGVPLINRLLGRWLYADVRRFPPPARQAKKL